MNRGRGSWGRRARCGAVVHVVAADERSEIPDDEVARLRRDVLRSDSATFISPGKHELLLAEFGKKSIEDCHSRLD